MPQAVAEFTRERATPLYSIATIGTKIHDDSDSEDSTDGHKPYLKAEFIDKSLELEMGWAVQTINQRQRNKS